MADYGGTDDQYSDQDRQTLEDLFQAYTMNGDFIMTDAFPTGTQHQIPDAKANRALNLGTQGRYWPHEINDTQAEFEHSLSAPSENTAASSLAALNSQSDERTSNFSSASFALIIIFIKLTSIDLLRQER